MDKKPYRIIGSLPFKIVLCFLTVLFAAAALFFACVSVFFYMDHGYYEADSYRNLRWTSTSYDQEVDLCCQIAYELYLDDVDPMTVSWLSPENTNFRYIITGYRADLDNGKDVVYTNLKDPSLQEGLGLRVEYDFESAVVVEDVLEYGEGGGQEWTTDWSYGGDGESVLLRYYVIDPPVVQDGFYTAWKTFQAAYPYRYTAIAAGAVFGLLFLVSLTVLLCSAGRRKGVEGVTLNAQDKIPLDLYLAVAAPLVVLAFFAILQITPDHTGGILALCALVLAAVVLLLATLMTLAARFKAGRWWRNTLVCRLLSLLKRPVRWLGKSIWAVLRGLPLIWKAVLLYVGIFLVDSILVIGFVGNYYDLSYAFPWFVLLALFNMAVLLALCLLCLGMHKLKNAGERLASGDFDQQTDTRWLHGEFRQHAVNLNSIGEGMSAAVEERLRSERLKAELITNVSHDIKTPLTSIINYVDLLEKQKLEGEAAEYLAVLSRQANRLRKLTEDLVEASKASTGNLQVELAASNLSELVRQAAGEYAERMEKADLEMVLTLPEDKLYALADGRHLWRIMDNLLGNACKYAQPGTRVYIDVFRRDGWAALVMKNVSKNRLGIDAEELMERFVRGDSSRSSSTEGSGLGLSIARSLAELQGGHFRLEVDGDLFKAIVWLQETQVPEAGQEPAEPDGQQWAPSSPAEEPLPATPQRHLGAESEEPIEE